MEKRGPPCTGEGEGIPPIVVGSARSGAKDPLYYTYPRIVLRRLALGFVKGSSEFTY